ncbi:Uma2 family endonuclease [Stieleria sp. ICT_E10.1]|uniref:Uma2 family endonuclease n=1 Tax=Stieleria sedimenti TaxID=2976331 RepID=UPI00217FEC12|nr:Uma2 family endonuclease [Stieleria sedimenti]MCS7466057.1 Uma2 family endonuclease [Stieleria sedimenti]
MSGVPKPLLSEADYLAYLAQERQADFKSEFYRGEVFAMTGASRRHNLIVGNVVTALTWSTFHYKTTETGCFANATKSAAPSS